MSDKIEQIEVKGGKLYDLTDKQAHLQIDDLYATKQDKLTEAQLEAVNSGITSTVLTNIRSNLTSLKQNKVDKTDFNQKVAELNTAIENLDNLKADKSELLTAKTELQANIDQEKIDRVTGDTNTLNSANAYTDSKVVDLQAQLDNKTDKSVTEELNSRVITNTADISTLQSQMTQKADKTELDAVSTRVGKAEIQAFENLPARLVTLTNDLHNNYYTKSVIAKDTTLFSEDNTVQDYIDQKVATGITFKGSVQNGTELLTKEHVNGHVWYVEENDGTEFKAGCSYIWQDSEYKWVLFSKSPEIDLSSYAKKTALEAESNTRLAADTLLQSNIDTVNTNVTNLTTRVGTAEGNIQSLNTNVTNLTTRVGTVEGKVTSIESTLSTKADKTELNNYYKKTETYNQTEIDNKLLLKQDELNSANAGENVVISKDASTGIIKISASTTASLDWSAITNKPTTISGYAITDAYTKTEIDTELNKKENLLTFEGKDGISVSRTDDKITISNDGSLAVKWGNITGVLANQTDLQSALDLKADKSTTLAGYGITDAYTKIETDTKISDEKTARENADKEINDKIGTGFDATNTVRKAIDDNTTAITTETTRATGVESGLNTRLTSVEEKIPSEASSTNQLADKEFVNTGLATKQDTLTFDNTPTTDSTNPVTSTGIKSYVDNKITGTFRYKGSVDNYSDLPTSGNEVGDVWNIKNEDKEHKIKAGDNVAWTGTEWDVLSGVVDLSNYYNKQEIGGSYTSTNTLTQKVDDEITTRTAADSALQANIDFQKSHNINVEDYGFNTDFRTNKHQELNDITFVDDVLKDINDYHRTPIILCGDYKYSVVGIVTDTNNVYKGVACVGLFNEPASLLADGNFYEERVIFLKEIATTKTHSFYTNTKDLDLNTKLIAGDGISLTVGTDGRITIVNTDSEGTVKDLKLRVEKIESYIPSDTSATNQLVNKTYVDTELAKKENLDEYTVRYLPFETTRKTIQLANHNTISGIATDGTGHNLVMLSKWDVADFGAVGVHLNLNTKDAVTVNDSDLAITDKLLDSVITSSSGAINIEAKTQSISGLTIKTLDFSAKSYTHEQTTASNEWIITHNLGKIPSLYVKSNGKRLICNMEIVDMNTVKLTMDGDYAGTAYLS